MLILDAIDDKLEKSITNMPWLLVDSDQNVPDEAEFEAANAMLLRLLRFTALLVHNACNKTTYNSLEVRGEHTHARSTQFARLYHPHVEPFLSHST